MSDLRLEFLAKLEERYGLHEEITSKFGTHSYGRIASDLCISSSQFTKLIRGTATQGMYIRALDNINRLIKLEELSAEKEILESQLYELDKEHRKVGHARNLWLFAIVMCFLGGTLISYGLLNYTSKSAQSPQEDHPLSDFFDPDFNTSSQSPYLGESEVQEYCPCSGYEGTWELANSYKLPLPGIRRPGLFYLARRADVRMKCSTIEHPDVGKGRTLMAYEHLVNEIWIDQEGTPLSPSYFDKTQKKFTAAFDSLDFHNHPNFAKVATIESFFVDRFDIGDQFISRSGEPAGRIVTEVNEDLVSRFQIDLKYILEGVLGDFTRTKCQETINPFCDPNDLKANESVISFDCIYTIGQENLGIGGGYPYIKSYRLTKQNYSDNLICSCNELTGS